MIPTPEFKAPGDPAPWTNVSHQERRGISLEKIESKLRSSQRHFDVANPPEEPAELRGIQLNTSGATMTRKSSVLVALFEQDGETRIILTRRSLELKSHRGEVALPGGRNDEGESSTTTALREAHEEIGLEPNAVRVVGWLSPIVTLASGSAIQPIVGFLNERPEMFANPSEVERVFDIELSYLLEDENFAEERWRRESPRPGARADGTFGIYFYKVPGEVIWGATSRVITELLAIVTGTEHSLPRWTVG